MYLTAAITLIFALSPNLPLQAQDTTTSQREEVSKPDSSSSQEIAGSNWHLLLAYTHHSWWQVYNHSWYRPFRETNYTPEVFFRHLQAKPIKVLGLELMALDLGLVHESNGQFELLSRSWDRAFARAYFNRNSLSVVLSGWVRIPENPEHDHNPQIETYMGVGEIEVFKSFGQWTLGGRIPIARKPGVELNLSYPMSESFRWFVSGFSGYGQSMIEYDVHSSRLAASFALDNYLDLITNSPSQ